MKRSILIGALAAGLGLGAGACGNGQEAQDAASTPSGAEAPQDDATYTAAGTVTAIAGNQVTIAHDAVKDLDWPAQTADFQAQSLDQIIDLRPGDKVSFSFSQAGGQYVLVSIHKRSG
ncbi:copper-binding protein [Pedomonas sp. V897]|uniref:copper-binding protein n=1 Tax=Pedomonas sp. V897 TaxID=3446482 RepID=UPI003EE0E262